MVNRIFIGFLVLVLLTSSIYILLPDKVRIDVQKTKTLISVYEDEKWVLGAREFLHLYDGTRKMRAKSREVTQKIDRNLITITRNSTWKDNITTVHEYVFDSTVSDVEFTPLEEKLYCFNCQGKIVHFEYRNIDYKGVTRAAVSPESFGHNIKVEWEEGYDWAKVYQQKTVPDKLIIRYRPQSSSEVYAVRLFDPPNVNSLKQCYIEYSNRTEDVYEDRIEFERVKSPCLYYHNYTYINNATEIDELRNETFDRYCFGEEEYTVQVKTGTKTIIKSKESCRVIGANIKGIGYDWDKQAFTCIKTGLEYTCDSQNADGNGLGSCESGEDTCFTIDIRSVKFDNEFNKFRK